jgi:O-succinylbenzoate synthase
MAEPLVRLAWRPFRLPLARPLVTAQGALTEKRGWLLRLEAEGPGDSNLSAPSLNATIPGTPSLSITSPGATGIGALSSGQGAPACLGWGEAAPLCFTTATAQERQRELAAAIRALGRALPRQALEASLPSLPPELAFALGLALAEADGLVGAAAGGWLAAPPSAVLLPAGEAAVAALAAALDRPAEPLDRRAEPLGRTAALPFTCKWKVAAAGDDAERELLEQLLACLPAGSRLRLDANGGWDRATAWQWAERLADDPRLEWLEQPLAPADLPGLQELAQRVPVALDESLQHDPALRRHWPGWQVRRPAVEGDPRPLLAALQQGGGGASAVVLSTAFETGIAQRLVGHLAALQSRGATPAAPGLAPGWSLASGLCAADPVAVWQAAGVALQHEGGHSL